MKASVSPIGHEISDHLIKSLTHPACLVIYERSLELCKSYLILNLLSNLCIWSDILIIQLALLWQWGSSVVLHDNTNTNTKIIK